MCCTSGHLWRSHVSGHVLPQVPTNPGISEWTYRAWPYSIVNQNLGFAWLADSLTPIRIKAPKIHSLKIPWTSKPVRPLPCAARLLCLHSLQLSVPLPMRMAKSKQDCLGMHDCCSWLCIICSSGSGKACLQKNTALFARMTSRMFATAHDYMPTLLFLHGQVTGSSLLYLPNKGSICFQQKTAGTCSIKLTISYALPSGIMASFLGALVTPLLKWMLAEDLSEFAKLASEQAQVAQAQSAPGS